ncbi:MAG: 2-oxoacid:acceptor oxidoreductase subunit alpha [bacterium]|nr:2-oxoacid:acceptor oxidoreductase subunit alpha [bacterium]
MDKRLSPGTHVLMANEAMAEGAIAAGCRFFAGYPITPQNEVPETMSKKLPLVGGTFIQMEDEMASIGACYGAAMTGEKVMTSTSGAGFCLMQEFISLAAYNEVPMVIGNVGRVSPGSGIVSLPHMGEVNQARWGGNGDYEIIALAPATAQESFDFAIEAFNLAEKWRTPVVILSDAFHGHIREKVVVPTDEELAERIVVRKEATEEDITRNIYYSCKVGDEIFTPPLPKIGSDYFPAWSTTISHNNTGFPNFDAGIHLADTQTICDKLTKNNEEICRVDSYYMDDAEVAVIAYGLPFRTALRAVRELRSEGVKAGLLRLITVWPFAETAVTEAAKQVKNIIVPEINLGQLFIEVERAAAKEGTACHLIPQIGRLHEPKEIIAKIKEVI